LVLLVAFPFLASPTPASLALGLPLTAAGLLFRIWASGYIYKNDRLATAGPYSVTRNPLYFGSFLAGAGILAAGAAWILLGIYLVTFPAVYLCLILTEEEHLEKIFGGEYRAYKERVPRLLPAFRKYTRPETSWSARLTFVEHKEYANILFAALITGFLLVKLFLS